MTNNLDRQVIELVATDRIYVPISSMGGKLERSRPKLAKNIARTLCLTGGDYIGERVFARIETDDELKARGMREGIEVFSENFPRYGKILNGMIEEQRAMRETHLYFGVNPGSRLTSDDYANVMANLGFSHAEANNLYPSLMDISRKLTSKRGERERSVLVG